MENIILADWQKDFLKNFEEKKLFTRIPRQMGKRFFFNGLYGKINIGDFVLIINLPNLGKQKITGFDPTSGKFAINNSWWLRNELILLKN